jgi:hypothetical protein
VLVNGLSDFEYLYPFYFGRSGENVFVMMFERPRDGSELRFAQSPSGGGTGNPAWDFVYFQRGYEVNREFCFRARAVLRKFKDAEEVIHLYEQWSGEKVVRPKKMTPKRNRQPIEIVGQNRRQRLLPSAQHEVPNGAKEVSPGLVRQWPCASTYPGKIVQQFFSSPPRTRRGPG